MTIADLTWPQASVYIALIAAVGLVVAVLVWSIFRTGQAAIRIEGRQREPLDKLRKDVDELRATLESSVASTGAGEAR
jgi:cytochrome c-type biogenesis protein CcmH/NrfG